MSENPKYAIRNNISLTQVDDEIVLLDLSEGTYFGLNKIGAQLLRGIQKETSIQELITQISEQYHMKSSAVELDIIELIEQLLENNLLIKQ